MASPNLSELVSTAYRSRRKQLSDNITDNMPFLERLKQKGNAEPASGGTALMEELMYAENRTVNWYSGYEQFDTSPSDVITAAEFEWKQLGGSVTFSGLESRIINAGKERTIKLIDSRLKVLEKTLQNTLNTGVFSDGTVTGQVGGLQLLVADDPTTGTVGSINRATYSFWRNYKYSGATDGGAAVSAANIRNYMNQVYMNTCRNSDKIDMILADNNYYSFFWESLASIQRIQETTVGKAGWRSLKFVDADVVLAGGLGGGIASNHMYFLNTDYIHYRPHEGTNFIMLDTRESINQDATVKIIVWAGNMTLSNAQLQGVLIA